MQVLANAGIMAVASMLVGILPLALGVVYAVWPSDHRLLLMRPLSLATAFAAVAGTMLGLLNELVFVARSGGAATASQMATGVAESLAPPFIGFGCLTIAWLCVAIGLWRRP